MRYAYAVLVVLGCLPLAGQAWDVRLGVPFSEGQRLPGTLIQGTGQLVDEGMDRSDGALFSVSHRLVRMNPVLRVDWGVEVTQLRASGEFQVGAAGYSSRLKQNGLGIGVNAQFWIPFTGAAAELGLIQRVQDYRFEAAGHAEKHTLNRTWLRVGARWRLPLPLAAPYIAASYQQPLSKSRPVKLNSAQDLASYLSAQGKGQ